jgi:hypothetical protein
LEARRPKLEEELLTLDKSLVDAWGAALAADKDFRDEVTGIAGCAKFTDVLSGVASIVTSVASGGAGGLGASAGLLKLWRDLGYNEKEDAKYPDWVKRKLASTDRRVKILEKVEADSRKVGEAVDKFRKLMGITDVRPPNDDIKFWMPKAEFDEMIKPYGEVASAKHLTALMDRFFSIRDERNELILVFDSLVAEVAETAAQADLAEEMEEEYVEENAATLLGDAQSLFEDAQWISLAFRNRLLRLLGETERAYHYWAAVPYRFDVDSSSPAHIADAVLRFQEAIRSRLNQRGPTTRFPSSIVPQLIIPLPRELYYDEIASLLAGQSTIISTSRFAYEDAPLGLYGLRADHVTVVIRSETASPRRLPLLVVHRGDGSVRAENNEIATFRHERRPARANAYVLHSADQPAEAFANNLKGADDAPDAQFIGVSPFATWTLRLDDPVAIDQSEVSAIELHFGGVGYVLEAHLPLLSRHTFAADPDKLRLELEPFFTFGPPLAKRALPKMMS